MVKLPPLWQQHWQTPDPFWHIFHLKGDVYREQPGRRTLRFRESNQNYFVKLHYGVGWKEIFKNLLQGRLPVLGARNEFFAIQKLEKLRFTPTVIAYGWRGYNPAKQISFLITEEIPCSTSLEEICQDWLNNPPPVKFKRALIYKVADIARQMHHYGINHRDFYLCHFLLDKTGGEGLFNLDNLPLYLIDLHRAQIRHRVPYRWRVKDIAALYFSAMDIGLTRQDLLRFIKRYNTNLSPYFWQDVNKRAFKLYRKIWGKLPQQKASI